MRIHATHLGAAAAAAMIVAVPAGAARPAPVCGPDAGHTLAQSRQARVYTVPQPTTGPVPTVGPGPGTRVVLACARGRSRRDQQIRLGYTNTCINSMLVQRVVLAGPVVAYAVEECGVDTGSTQLVVLHVPRNRTLATASAGDSPGPESYTTVDSLVVRADGAAAWIAFSQSLGRSTALKQVWKLEHSRTTLLDSGSGIAVRSLRLRGRSLLWRDRGQRSATLR